MSRIDSILVLLSHIEKLDEPNIVINENHHIKTIEMSDQVKEEETSTSLRFIHEAKIDLIDSNNEMINNNIHNKNKQRTESEIDINEEDPKKSININKLWTKEEDKLLLKLCRERRGNWVSMCNELPRWTRIEIKIRYKSLVRASKRMWKKSEDQLLMDKCYKMKKIDLEELVHCVPGRSKHSIKERCKLLLTAKGNGNENVLTKPAAPGSPRQVFVDGDENLEFFHSEMRAMKNVSYDNDCESKTKRTKLNAIESSLKKSDTETQMIQSPISLPIISPHNPIIDSREVFTNQQFFYQNQLQQSLPNQFIGHKHNHNVIPYIMINSNPNGSEFLHPYPVMHKFDTSPTSLTTTAVAATAPFRYDSVIYPAYFPINS